MDYDDGDEDSDDFVEMEVNLELVIFDDFVFFLFLLVGVFCIVI